MMLPYNRSTVKDPGVRRAHVHHLRGQKLRGREGRSFQEGGRRKPFWFHGARERHRRKTGGGKRGVISDEGVEALSLGGVWEEAPAQALACGQCESLE